MQSVLSELEQHFSIGEWSNKVVVVKGDLCSHNLGLSEEDYSLVCSTAGVIIHNGAVVNAALPYEGTKRRYLCSSNAEPVQGRGAGGGGG